MQKNVVGFVVVFSADLALVDALVSRSNVLYDETPFVHSLVVVNTDPSVWRKRIEPDRQRMNFIVTLPRDLRPTPHVTVRAENEEGK